MVSIDLISGFLGAGKTTFCNLLLKHYMETGAKPVYIVNEFGQTGLDADIIKADGFEAVEMFGGCICCTLKGEVSVAIIKVIEAFSPTHIVFEPSGIFIFDDFFDILKVPEIKQKCVIGNVLTIVDGVNFTYAKAMFGNFLYNQIKNAPTLVISKLEKSRCAPDELVADLRNINPEAFIMAKKWEQFSSEDFKALLTDRKGMVFNYPEHIHGRFQSATVKPPEPFSQEALDELCDMSVSGVFGDLFRVKGVLNTAGGPILLNIAREDVSIEYFKGYSESTLTFIGITVDKCEIEHFLSTAAQMPDCSGPS
ncbi:MAG: GTP-binding protein [Oscillospiraceae bacterium]|nr:GTP-binding protein [Oscillospiraceae bacterium]